MIRLYVELSGESPALAVAEALAAAEAVGGRAGTGGPEIPGLAAVDVPDEASARRLSERLALARRCLVAIAVGSAVLDGVVREGGRGRSAAFRRIGRPSGGHDPRIPELGREYRQGGGTIDLEHPERRFWLAEDPAGEPALFEEVAEVERRSAEARRMPLLPFQRPVSLPPRLARAAANLAGIRPGDAVLDPFLGTGALLAEAALLGARVYGVDRDAAMVRGALRNFAFLGVTPEALQVGDAGDVALLSGSPAFSAILTDPPYGRASSTGGEAADRLVDRVVRRWTERLVPGGRLVLVVPQGSPTPAGFESPRVSVPVRVHRSLTREFRLYVRPETRGPSPTGT